ncbi:SPOR domain-containing protein [Candidatus Endoriftia persephone]|jgi:cell division protein FtsN|uniref:Sporulation and cell division repeat protein n=3 Tax=Gammaproteobacteria TaxID=1236 RepID=G2DB75_9GAMM|nr:SPOR domain-containing protein [Candidatus Endoriftia persephone]EGV52098.1 sporulation and cell division repeat protein [endosymbiont of Riftia pachyptila (vent Ph05)]EGW54594.1 putative cell division protein [endosymbiont of Tevnia jerichonana (vent Tica)]USF87522.1 SPOR domain-containing protein [Candidatus Endoriftia persephone]
MADFKHRATPKERKRSERSCGLWFFSGLISGAFVMGLVWLQYGPQMAAGQIPGVSKQPVAEPRSAPAKPPETPKPHFDFYTILPEMEVLIPEEEINAPEPAPAAIPPPVQKAHVETRPVAKDKSAYILQMGSFRKFADADRMKARLALIGIEAEIQRVSINNNQTYHRVRSRPYPNRQALNHDLALARQNQIKTLIIKLKR